ncbi:hypothetical protein Moror_13017 [Moniliophthora roreri MCA 2997]|uniref:Uncharacterized protein n=1 Tax=Moniliophthora roreri (strain MCA 2997) TaxID=1381753 RepID=V2X413_MONRO|nr:hypothetical protein Moror_13017 [Moniliophthora roreri MCA 2997]
MGTLLHFRHRTTDTDGAELWQSWGRGQVSLDTIGYRQKRRRLADGDLLMMSIGIRWYPMDFEASYTNGYRRIPSDVFSLGVSEIIISPCPSVYELWESGVAFRIFLCPILLVANL